MDSDPLPSNSIVIVPPYYGYRFLNYLPTQDTATVNSCRFLTQYKSEYDLQPNHPRNMNIYLYEKVDPIIAWLKSPLDPTDDGSGQPPTGPGGFGQPSKGPGGDGHPQRPPEMPRRGSTGSAASASAASATEGTEGDSSVPLTENYSKHVRFQPLVAAFAQDQRGKIEFCNLSFEVDDIRDNSSKVFIICSTKAELLLQKTARVTHWIAVLLNDSGSFTITSSTKRAPYLEIGASEVVSKIKELLAREFQHITMS